MTHHKATIYPPECTHAAKTLRRLDLCKASDAVKEIIHESATALDRAAYELNFLENLMRTAQQTLADLLADDKAKRTALDAATQANADLTEANSEFAAAMTVLQKKYDDLVAKPPVANSDDTIAPDDPARIEANQLLDSQPPVGDPVP